MPSHKEIYTTCTRDCPNTCGLKARVEDGKLVKLTGSQEHPLTRGKSCVKVLRYVKRVYHKDRVLYPMIRVNGQWERATWDQALDLVADKMHTIAAQDGNEAILYYQGYGERTALKLLNGYFFNLFGGVTTLTGSLCGGTGQGSQNLDFGNRISHDPLDHYNSKSMILWGRNPVSTNISLVPIIRDLRKRGGTVILVDPFKNKSAALAHRHIAPIPGRDVYLAMAITKLILEHGGEDRSFLKQNSVGAEEYLAILDRYTVPELCSWCAVSEEDADFMAQVMLRHRPTSILLGWGMHRHEHAHLSIRAIDALGAISGNIGVPGGGVSQGFEEYGPYDQQYWGEELNPPRRKLLMPCIGEEILNATNPRIRMIFSTAANPVCMAPNSDKVIKAFKETEFVVYNGHFLDDTADHADVFLPATTFLEEDDVMATYGHNYVGPVNKAIEPLGECLSNFDMFQELSKRFSFASQYRKAWDVWLEKVCTPIWEQGCTPEQLRQGPFRLDAPMAPYVDGVFSTSSGKFEFMTTFDPADLRDKDPEYPYTLLTIAPHDYICSERTLEDHPPLPPVWLHPEEAARRGVAEGETVLVSSVVGEIQATLCLDPTLRHDCMVAERGGWLKAGHGLNRLTRDMASVVGNGTPYYETTVTLKSISGASF